ncbi:hypothetical protein [Pseudomonas sp.]|uniref:hypothetical protein n=1 Tax=Pseudomonas sp. TaxID=306 RepID=UPI003A9735A8
MPDEIRRRVIAEIGKSIRVGHSEAFVSLEDLNLDFGIPDKELEELQKGIIEELEKAGYRVKWDDITTISIEFK